MSEKNIFKGESAIFDYLVPGAMGFTPIIELPERINPYKKDGIKIFLKLMNSSPLANLKSMPAWYMLNSISKNDIKKIKHLVEYSSGNMVLSLAVLSRHFGIKNMHAIITPDVPKNKQNLLKLLGVDLIISHGPPCPDVFAKVGGVWDAKQMGKKTGWKNLNQYVNPNSPRGSKEIIGRELWRQLGKQLDVLCVSLGTGATVLGSGSYLKKKNPKLFIIATSIKKGHSIPGPRNEEAVKKLHFPWWDVVDLEYPVEGKPAFEKSIDLIREGIFVGPSTGMQLAGILEFIRKFKKEKKLGQLKRGRRKEVNIVIVAGDTMFPYIEDYFTMVPDKLAKK